MGFNTLRQIIKIQTDESLSKKIEKPVVMIIDDDTHLLEDLAFSLKDDYHVLGCPSGSEGMERLDETVSAVVLDIRMPGQDGFQIFKAIKERLPHLPVLFHSAYQDLKDPYEIMNQYRPFGYISKSAGLPELKDSIDSAVDYYSQIRRNRELVRELTLTKEYLDNIIHSMPSMLIGLDAKTQVVHWNRKAWEKTGIPPEKAAGQPLESLLPEMAGRLEEVREIMTLKSPKKLDTLVFQENGKTRYTEILVYPLENLDAGGAVIRLDDVTERVMFEEMMVKTEKMMMVSGLAAGIAHEINNPLSIILQSIEVTRQRLSPEMGVNQKAAVVHGVDLEKLKGYLKERKIFDNFDHIEQASLRTSEIVQNMLNFSRQYEIHSIPTDIEQLIEETLSLSANEYTLKNDWEFQSIEIIREYEDWLPRVPCVRVEIAQVLMNLIRNAVQALYPSGGDHPRRITIKAGVKDQMAVITVSDTGKGMGREIVKRVFDPFFTTKSPGQGTGLGLSVSLHIVREHHQGDLLVESAPGQGATFTLLLPLSDRSVVENETGKQVAS
jgi:PAS domain S-box-containing protein